MGTWWCFVGSHNPHVLQSRLPTCAGHKTTLRPPGVVYCWLFHSSVFFSCGLFAPGALCDVMVTAARQPSSTALSACSRVSHDAMLRPLRCEPLVSKKWL